MGDEPQGTRKFPNDAVLLSGPPRSPLFAEAEENMQRTTRVNVLHSKILMRLTINKQTGTRASRISQSTRLALVGGSPCGGAGAAGG